MGARSRSGVRVRDAGRREVAAQLRALADVWAKIGVIGQARREDEETDQVEVAAANEFGTSTIPERSFIRSTVDERQADLREVVRAVTREVAAGRRSAREAGGILGQWMQAAIRQQIVDVDTPPNAPETIERKVSSNPLIDTGQMRQSITYEVETGRRPRGGG
jgi:hypothetical protein